jgi:hypothetical protein
MVTPRKPDARPYIDAFTRRAQYIEIARALEATGEPWGRKDVADRAGVSPSAVTMVISFGDLVAEAKK